MLLHCATIRCELYSGNGRRGVLLVAFRFLHEAGSMQGNSYLLAPQVGSRFSERSAQ